MIFTEVSALSDTPLQIDFPEGLPVSARRDEIMAAMDQHQVIIVCGETGSGKTTQLPKIALAMGRGLCNYPTTLPNGKRQIVDVVEAADFRLVLQRQHSRAEGGYWVERLPSVHAEERRVVGGDAVERLAVERSVLVGEGVDGRLANQRHR